jgi:hypothetical protein
MPFLTGFTKRKELRYSTVFPDSNLTDFPKLFVISGDADLIAELSGGGGIAVTEADETTEVPFGLYPSSDPAGGTLILRAKFTMLTAATTGDVIGYLYYDSGATTTQDRAGVVSNGYVLFMPLEEDPSGSSPQMRDWVTDSLLGVANGTMTSGDLVTGTVGKALDFDGSDDRISVTGITALNGANHATLEAIVTKASATSGTAGVGFGDNSTSRFNFLWFSDGNVYHQCENGGNSFPFVALSGAGPHSIAIAYDGTLSGVSRCRALHDGVVKTLDLGVGANPSATLSSNEPFFVGWETNGYSTAVIDEVRVSSVTRSDAWLEYAYADDFSNTDTFDLGPEEDAGGADTYTATADLTSSGMTLSASATFSPGTKTATAALTASSMTLAASATFAPGTKTATVSLTTSVMTLVASATSDTPTYTATSVLTATAITLAATATHTTPVYEAAGDLTASSMTLAAVVITEELYAAVVSLTTGSMTLSAAGTFTAPVYTATSSLTASSMTLTATANQGVPVYTATSALTISSMALSAVVTHTDPIFTGSVALAISSMTLAANAGFVAPSYTATGVLVISSMTLEARETALIWGGVTIQLTGSVSTNISLTGSVGNVVDLRGRPMADNIDIEVYRNEDVRFEIDVTAADMDFDDADLRFDVLTGHGTTPLVTKNNGVDGGITVTEVSGGADVLVTVEGGLDLTPRTYKYAFYRYDEGLRTMFTHGNLKVNSPRVRDEVEV